MTFFITYRGHPVRFVRNMQQRAWSACHRDDATTFASVDEAMVKLVDWSLHGNGLFKVEEKEHEHIHK